MTDEIYEEILPNIILVQCSFVSIVLAKAERLAVFDTGVAELMPAAIVPALAALGEEVSSVNVIVNTHGHWDHVQGNAAIQQASHAPVWIPAADFDKLASPADRLLVDGDKIDLGNGLCFEVIATPGHSAGMSCLYERTRRVLIASDTAQGYGVGDYCPIYYYSGRQYRASLQRLLQLDIEIMTLGHRFKWSGASQMVHRGATNIRRYLQESIEASAKVETAVRAALEDCPGREFDNIRQAVARNLSNDPTYPFDPRQAIAGYSLGTVYSELNDSGIQHTNSN